MLCVGSLHVNMVGVCVYMCLCDGTRIEKGAANWGAFVSAAVYWFSGKCEFMIGKIACVCAHTLALAQIKPNTAVSSVSLGCCLSSFSLHLLGGGCWWSVFVGVCI